MRTCMFSYPTVFQLSDGLKYLKLSHPEVRSNLHPIICSSTIRGEVGHFPNRTVSNLSNLSKDVYFTVAWFSLFTRP